jgi:hypothetical protein
MFMTRTDALLEIAEASGNRIAIALDRISSAALATRRDTAGRLANVLVIEHLDGRPALTLPGPMELLAIIHQRIAEAMADIVPAATPASAPAHDELAWDLV